MEIGDTFLLIDKSIDEHLWIVISDPAKSTEQVVLVNLTSHDSPDKDGSCILEPTDHPWIKHTTSVCYRDSRVTTESNLDALVVSGSLVRNTPASDGMLKKIFEGC